MTKALHLRIVSNGQIGGTHVYDCADDCELANVQAVRFDHRLHHEPIVVLELRGGQLMVTDSVLGMAETQAIPQTTEEPS